MLASQVEREVGRIAAARDLYDVLGVPMDATDAEIKQMYRRVRAISIRIAHTQAPAPKLQSEPA